MAFAEEIEKQVRKAKLHSPCLTTIAKIKGQFLERHKAGEFAGSYWAEIAEQFHNTVNGKCRTASPYRSAKSGGHKRGSRNP